MPSPFMSLVLLVWNQSGLIKDQSRELMALSLFMSPEMSLFEKVKVWLLDRVKVCFLERVLRALMRMS